MSWQGIAGHDALVEQFRRALERGRLASTFLFVGPSGIGKRSFALALAQSLLCSERQAAALDPCGKCPSCSQVLAGTHPDLMQIARPAGKAEIPLRLLIGEGERRMHEGLCHDIALRPFMGGYKVALIDDADHLNEEGANCLLKTLEEPPPRSVLILIGTSPAKQLPTIRSRCQIIRFQPLPAEDVEELLLGRLGMTDRDEARRLARYSGGSLERALELSDPELWKFRSELWTWLAQPRTDNVRFAPVAAAFIDAAGKEAAPRRARARQVIDFAIQFHRGLLRALGGESDSADDELRAAVSAALSNWQGDEETIAATLDRSLEALDHIDRNANQAAWLECWLADLSAQPPRQASASAS
jgi:DNA polymerase-3 subunit delta'